MICVHLSAWCEDDDGAPSLPIRRASKMTLILGSFFIPTKREMYSPLIVALKPTREELNFGIKLPGRDSYSGQILANGKLLGFEAYGWLWERRRDVVACDARRRHGDGTAASGCHVRQYMCRCGSGKEQRQGVDSSAVCGGQSTMSTAVGFIPTLALERGSATTRSASLNLATKTTESSPTAHTRYCIHYY
ncbi:Os08g0516525 [Oryza sativa Japonica Group]|uniref:Os08g0516525 protein n=1 Tax=Oryza sativa subsp. japonica TaxID=39947 RepID=A0A0P0XI08_ORYSJ|nr:Os08g0516525 [Oryza sativa Japonica Group]